MSGETAVAAPAAAKSAAAAAKATAATTGERRHGCANQRDSGDGSK
jgi:hypothetical protein